MNAMKLYGTYIRNIVRQSMTYRFEYFMRLVGMLCAITVQYFIWKSLLSNAAQTNYGTISFEDMIRYVMLSSMMGVITRDSVIATLDSKISTGEIAMDLIKPLNLKVILFCQSLGNGVFQLFCLCLPVLIFVSVFIDVEVFSISYIVVYSISFLNAYVLLFLTEYCLGILGFWFTQVWILGRFLGDFIKLFAGSLIPLWFFPVWLQNVSACLPFKYMYFVPISIGLGVQDVREIILSISVQVLWILCMYILGCFLWKKAVYKVVIQGG